MLRRRGLADHPFTTAASIFWPLRDNHPKLRRDDVKAFRNILKGLNGELLQIGGLIYQIPAKHLVLACLKSIYLHGH